LNDTREYVSGNIMQKETELQDFVAEKLFLLEFVMHCKAKNAVQSIILFTVKRYYHYCYQILY